MPWSSQKQPNASNGHKAASILWVLRMGRPGQVHDLYNKKPQLGWLCLRVVVAAGFGAIIAAFCSWRGLWAFWLSLFVVKAAFALNYLGWLGTLLFRVYYTSVHSIKGQGHWDSLLRNITREWGPTLRRFVSSLDLARWNCRFVSLLHLTTSWWTQKAAPNVPSVMEQCDNFLSRNILQAMVHS